jgi:hypothetical protein
LKNYQLKQVIGSFEKQHTGTQQVWKFYEEKILATITCNHDTERLFYAIAT